MSREVQVDSDELTSSSNEIPVTTSQQPSGSRRRMALFDLAETKMFIQFERILEWPLEIAFSSHFCFFAAYVRQQLCYAR